MKLIQINKTVIALSFAIIGTSCSTTPELTSLEPRVEQRLNVYQNKMTDYENQNIRFISPDKYDRVNEIYKEAKEMAYQNKPLTEVDKKLSEAKGIYLDMDKDIKMADIHLEKVIEARNKALSLSANELEEFKEADEKFKELASEFEEGEINEALKERNEVIMLYRKAYVVALRKIELDVAYNFLKDSENIDTVDYFNTEKLEVEEKIKTAEKLIDTHLDEPHRYKAAVDDANKSAHQLFSYTYIAKWMESKGMRGTILTLDAELNKILEPLDHNGITELSIFQKLGVAESELASIDDLVARISESKYRDYIQTRRMKELRANNSLLANRIEQNKELRESIEKIRKSFGENEAEVYIDKDNLVIRLIGVKFAFDDATLPEHSKSLLKKVGQVADEIDYKQIKIVGHADSRGDSEYNKTLSKKRAENVNKFLIYNTEIESSDTELIGVGFNRPVAANKTEDGRKANRRVDVVFENIAQ